LSCELSPRRIEFPVYPARITLAAGAFFQLGIDHMICRLRVLMGCFVFTGALSSMSAAEPSADKSNRPTYSQDVAFLKRHTSVVELSGGGARVAVCPEYQGRVMTSTCTGPQGPSHGWVNRDFIAAGKPSLVFNNYGGEDRFWLAPEAGQFAFYFHAGKPQVLDNWYTDPALNEGAFQEQNAPDHVRLTRRLQLKNYSGTPFDLEVVRDVRLLDKARFAELFGAPAAKALGAAALVGFETDNTVTNRGPALSDKGGLFSIWTLGQFTPGPRVAVIVPYVAGDEAQLGPVVTSDYFGPVPADRLQVTPQAVLFRVDGKFRSKLGLSPQRAQGIAGSIDFDQGVLTLVSQSLPPDPAKLPWVNNSWVLPQEHPFVGDAFNSYNDGSGDEGKPREAFYELETLSPTKKLATGESLRHAHRTFHVQGDLPTLSAVAKAALGIDLETVRKAMGM